VPEHAEFPWLKPTNLSQRFWAGLLGLVGWRVRGHIPDVPKYVLVVAPHTSYWDWPLLFAASRAIALPFATWLGKHTIFWGPLGWVFRRLGGIPIDRSHSVNFVTQVVTEFAQSEQMLFALAPEGTRSLVAYWKSGFYNIARQAQVPVALIYMDYPQREIGIDGPFELKGDPVVDMEMIRAFYRGVQGRHPELQGPVRLRQEGHSPQA
jgi:1-acyl-sn-glycerol-3-phosphate acyltransferase